MKIEWLDFQLPEDRIALRPLPNRGDARLLVLDVEREVLEQRVVSELSELIEPGSLVVVNDTKVLPARLLGTKQGTGGKVELLLLERAEGEETNEARATAGTSFQIWWALGRSSKPLREGHAVHLAGEGRSAFDAIVIGRRDDGTLLVRLQTEEASVESALELHGRVPLPPYIDRQPDDDDRLRYQTIFAQHPGAVAAPTAGLHLSEEFFVRLQERNVQTARVTLHVGLGTFRPVAVQDLNDHPMHAETYVVPEETARAIASTRGHAGRVVAIGTTVLRALESAADPRTPGCVRAQGGSTRLLIQPGYRFQVVDSLLTNFHLPRSTLLALVCAFAGRKAALDAYQRAISLGYRFYSYGDAMWIPRRQRESAMDAELARMNGEGPSA